ncbi:MAG: metallophosphoesterase family protein [Sphingomonas sp.]|uniref:metallophosphoesterase family protein n=1 Tax=Sphingomonas sp. TaxID=28214 RepID=UPI003F7DB515
MKIALLSDIHANLAALDAVLADLPLVDAILFAGDAVGYYAHPNEVCERLRAIGARCVRGNHDNYVTGQAEPNAERRAAYATDWTRERLTPENLAWLASLPAELHFAADGVDVIVRHASPWDEETYLYPDSDRLGEVALGANQVLVLGHTHHPMAVVAGDGLLINPGSVGQPRDWNPDAAYALLTLPSCKVEPRRVAYDVAAVQEELQALDWGQGAIGILSRRR